MIYKCTKTCQLFEDDGTTLVGEGEIVESFDVPDATWDPKSTAEKYHTLKNATEGYANNLVHQTDAMVSQIIELPDPE